MRVAVFALFFAWATLTPTDAAPNATVRAAPTRRRLLSTATTAGSLGPDATVQQSSLSASNPILASSRGTRLYAGLTTGGLDPNPRLLLLTTSTAAISLNGQPVPDAVSSTSGDSLTAVVADPEVSAVFVAGTAGGDIDSSDGTTWNNALSVFAARFVDSGTSATASWSFQGGSELIVANGAALSADSSLFFVGATVTIAMSGFSIKGGTDFGVLALNSSGVLVDAWEDGTTGTDTVASVAVESAADGSASWVYVAGTTDSAVTGASNSGGTDATVAKLDAASLTSVSWWIQLGSSADETVSTVVHMDGAVYVSGTTEGAVGSTASAGGVDLFVVRLNATTGSTVWTWQGGSSSDESSAGLAVDSSTLRLFVAGYTTASSFHGFTNAGGSDGILAQLTPAGELRWWFMFGSSSDDKPSAVAVEASTHRVFVAGPSAAGNSAVIRSFDPVVCARGSYHNSSASSGCTECPAGTYSETLDALDSSYCVACTAGTFSAVVGADNSSTCAACPRGFEAPSAGSTSCAACAVNKVTLLEGTADCEYCVAGSAPASNGTECTQCSAGTAASPGDATCAICDTGKYAAANASSCTPCAPGSFSNVTTGAFNCSLCDPGYYAANDGSLACTACPAGKAVAVEGSDALADCVDCALGKHSAAGSGTCSSCGEGTFLNLTGQPTTDDVCIPCPRGSASSAVAAANCTLCEPGYFSSGTGATTCSPCAAGTYTNETGSHSCTACPAGTYANAQSAATECLACPLGTANEDAGGANITACQTCAEGKYSASNGSTTCTNCPVGKYNPSTGQSSCLLCSAGKYNPNTGRISESSACISCAVGKFSDESGSSACTSCDAGKYADSTQSTSCTDCPVGQFSRKTSEVCTDCPLGTYTDQNGTADECTLCSTGTYNDAEGRNTSCILCPEGKFFSFTGGVSFSNCTDCPVGKYSSAGSFNCTDCPAGTEAPTEGTAECVPCNPGWYSPSPGQQRCTPCAKGSYMEDTNATAAFYARSGRTTMKQLHRTERHALTVPLARTRGHKALFCANRVYVGPTATLARLDAQTAQLGRSVLHLVEQGSSHAPIAQQARILEVVPTSAVAVRAGRTLSSLASGHRRIAPSAPREPTTPRRGATKPVIASNAHLASMVPPLDDHRASIAILATYQNSTGQASCYLCPAGTANNVYYAYNISFCIPCPAGKYRPTAGGWGCGDCPEGTYASSEGTVECDLAPRGTHVPYRGQVYPHTCWQGSYAEREGSKACSLCAEGTYSTAVGADNRTTCVSCPLDVACTFQQGANSSAACVQCVEDTVDYGQLARYVGGAAVVALFSVVCCLLCRRQKKADVSADVIL
eukprot:CAMPEP_0196773242 /NCGR_PEP_ID=MMETSP1104-20130614/2654_1 /TAXON_ID=33652 /ORGANISM="Cafeteria sp., Strain Caron Lab Isolate" /LENGTH=1335 /DNA_ID=CAMNT_0042143387 /DNA_START=42 /DNA_END=4049 /DNA_ORIENTATION=-